MALHIIKLVVGLDSVEELVAWQRAQARLPEWRVHTRMTPKRADEVLDGGSLYRVFKGVITCRQEILGIETVGEGRASRCHIVVSPAIVRVAPTPRRPFQGWRYLKPEDAPPDLDAASGVEAIPPALAAQHRSLGAW
jgi:hypothetical protein